MLNSHGIAVKDAIYTNPNIIQISENSEFSLQQRESEFLAKEMRAVNFGSTCQMEYTIY